MTSHRALLTGAVLCLASTALAQSPQPDLSHLGTPPLGLPPMPITEAQRPTPAEFALGARLFADTILSVDRSISCASCHPPTHGFASEEPLPAGAGNRRALRHAPSLFNRGYGKSQLWDGRAASLEDQVLQPIENPNEMGMTVDEALRRLRQDTNYEKQFKAAGIDEITAPKLAHLLASFVRGIVSGDSPVDRFQAGKIHSLTKAEKAGLWVFESKGACWKCHTPPLFSDESFHNTGIGAADGQPEEGRAAITGEPEDRGRFKTPTLREVAHNPPYMHDGSIATLEEVVEFYRRGGNANANLDHRMAPLNLTDTEARNLVAFLRALSRR